MTSFSVSFRALLLTSLSGAALMMGACSGGDKSSAEPITVGTASLGLDKTDERALSRYFSVPKRSGSEAETLNALEGLGLQASSDLTVGERVIDGADVTYTDWRVQTDDGTVTAKTVILTGVREENGRSVFDRMSVTDLVASGEDLDTGTREVYRAALGTLVVVEPTPDLAAQLARVLRGEEDNLASGEKVAELSGEDSFKALRLDDLTVDVTRTDAGGETESGDAKIGQIIIGLDRDNETMDAVVERVSFDWIGSGEGTDDGLVLDMDGLTVMGLNLDDKDAPVGTMSLIGMGLSALTSPSLKVPYRQVSMGAFTFKSRMAEVSAEGFEAQSSVKGDVTEMRSVLRPLAVRLKDISATPFGDFAAALRENGFEDITLKGSQTTTIDRGKDLVSISDARTEIDGGLKMDCDYAISGAGAAQAMLEASDVTMPEFSGFNTDADFETYMAQVEAYNEVKLEANKLIKLNGLSCAVQDVAENSLVTRGYAVASAVTGSPVAVLKGMAKTTVAMGSLTARTEFERELMDNVGSGLIEFLDKPGQTMTITMAPETPVSLSTLSARPDQASIAALNLNVEVE